MEVKLSDKMKAVLADSRARQQLSAALAQTPQQRSESPATVTVGATTYTVVVGPASSGKQ